MMEFIRNKSKGIAMWGVVGIIIASFALFGVESYLSGASSSVPATVNGTDISSSQLTRAVQARKQQLQQQFGSNYNPDMFPADFLRQQALNDLISRKLVADFTIEANMAASAEQVYNEIIKIPQFKGADGKFSTQIYSRALKGAGRNKAGFEADVARDYVLNQLREGIFNSSLTLPYEVEQTQQLLNQQREIGYLLFSKNNYKKNQKISEDELKKYYDSHLPQYMTQEKVDVEYVELDIDKVAEKIDIATDDVVAYYEENIKTYTDKDYPEALNRINDVKRRITKGESFDKIAKEMSIDGGELGFVRKGTYDKSFDDIVFKLKQGEISTPVKTDFGYHLIKVLEIKDEERKLKHILMKPLDKPKTLNAALRAEIKKDLQRQEAEKTFFEDVEKFSNLAYENADSLESVASGMDLNIQSTGLVIRNDLRGVLANPQVSTAVYSEQVLAQGKNSDVIELKETHLIVVRIKDHQRAAQKQFEDVKNDVTEQVIRQNQIAAMQEDVNLAYKNINAGEKGREQPQNFTNSRWVAAKYMSRRSGLDSKVPGPILRKAFSLARPAEEKNSVAIVDMANGDKSIVVVSAVKDSDQLNKTEMASITQQLQQQNTNTIYLGFEKYLKDNAEISVNLGSETEQDI